MDENLSQTMLHADVNEANYCPTLSMQILIVMFMK